MDQVIQLQCKNSFIYYCCNKIGHRSFECKNKIEIKKESEKDDNFASNYGESEDDEVGIAFCSIEDSQVKTKSRRKATFNTKPKFL